jgi:hypothetical protein
MGTDYSQRLEILNLSYGRKIYPSATDSRHHMAVNSELYKFEGIGVLPLFLRNFVDSVPEYVSGEYAHRVREGEVNRLDLISWKYYGTPELFWVIMAVNDIVNPFDVAEGTVLRIIPKSFIEYYLIRYYK